MSRLLLTVLLYLIPGMLLLMLPFPRRWQMLVPSLAGLAFLWFSGGFPSLILFVTAVCAAWLFLRLFPHDAERRPKQAGIWLACGLTVQALLLLAAKYLLPSPVLLIPQIVCAMQSAECMTERRAGQLSAMGLFPFFCYSCGLPHLLGGPPRRWQEVAGAWQERHVTAVLCGEGASRCIRGCFEIAVLALPLHTLLTELHAIGSPQTAADAWLALPVTYFMLYYALRGASGLGQGLANLLGFRMPETIGTPLLAGTLHGFRTRFLIPENAWCERMLPLPPGNPIGCCMRLCVLLGGFGFLIGQGICGMLWGITAALLLNGERLTDPEHLRYVPLTLRRLLTALLILIPLGMLRSASLQELFPFYRSLLGFDGMALSPETAYLLRSRAVILLLCTAGLFPLEKAGAALTARFPRLRTVRKIMQPLCEILMLAASLAALYSGWLRG